MGRIVIAWEFGGGLGHILYDLPLAKKLVERGHEVICIMKHAIEAERMMGQHGIKVIQAPIWQIKVKQLPNTYNYTETLFNHGYLVKGALLNMVKAWRYLLDLAKLDLLIADNAPTCLIAARGTKSKIMLYGTGFFAPPIQNPLPSIIPWEKPPEGLIEYSDKKAISLINSILEKTEAPLLNSLADLFVVDENILATFHELDHYNNRKNAKYWGPVINLPGGERPQWPGQSDKKKVFCYLKLNYPHYDEIITALNQIDAACIVFTPNLSQEKKERIQFDSLIYYDNPLDMSKVCEECDLVVCHAGHGTVAVALLHGKPLLLLPEHNHLEQVLTGRNIAMQKLGLVIFTGQKNRDYGGVINTLLSDPEFQVQAEKFARKYKGFNPSHQLEEIADRCEELMKSDR